MGMTGRGVFADVTDMATYSSEVKNEMSASYADQKYTTSGGGYYTVSDLLLNTDPDHPNVWVINEKTYSQLTSTAQTDFISDLNKAANTVVANSKNGEYTDESTANWYKVLQMQEGVGTKFMNVILENTKPDFVTANRLYQPFSGVVGTIMGLIAVVMMGFLGIVMVADIAYITLPPVRLFVADDDKGSGVAKSKIFSHDALYAVQQAENDSQGGNGSPKQALGIYLKRRIFMLILLGICLLYLVQGSIYVFVGYILDLVSGFIGF